MKLTIYPLHMESVLNVLTKHVVQECPSFIENRCFKCFITQDDVQLLLGKGIRKNESVGVRQDPSDHFLVQS